MLSFLFGLVAPKKHTFITIPTVRKVVVVISSRSIMLTWLICSFLFQPSSASQLVNETQKQMELQRRQHEQLVQQQQKLQELQGQITAQYAAGGVGPQGLMFLPFLDQLRGLQPAGLPPGVAKSALSNHVSCSSYRLAFEFDTNVSCRFEKN